MKSVNQTKADQALDTVKEAGQNIADKASTAAESGKAQVAAAVEGVRPQVAAAVEEGKAQVAAAVEGGKAQVVEFLEEKTGEAAAQVGDIEHALRQTAQEVDSPVIGQQIERLADGLESLAKTLESTHFEDVVASVDRLSHERPTIFLAGSFALGLAISRFLRASARPAPISRATY